MFIIITGPDLAGKTTLMTRLKERYPKFIHYKGGRPLNQQDAEDTLWRVLLEAAHNKQDYICDRFNYPDEIIYAKVFSHGLETAVNLQDQEAGILRFLKELGGFFVYLTAPIEVLQERLAARGDPHVTPEMVEMMHHEYERLFDGLPFPHVRIDTSTHVPNQVFEAVAYQIMNHQHGVLAGRFGWRPGRLGEF